MAKNKIYVVVRGTNPGIYDSWYGEDGAEAQVKGFPNALYKGFKTLIEAEEWYHNNNGKLPASSKKEGAYISKTNTAVTVNQKSNTVRDLINENQADVLPNTRKVVFYTDGGCSNNPGAGGYGVVCLRGNKRKELSGGFRKTTNNRMEMMACIVALRSLKSKHSVIIYSDSKYVVEGINKGWADKWKVNGWMRTKTEKAVNVDLWSELLNLYDKHNVKFKWVKGHAGNPENERCDKLALRAMSKKGLPPDINYEERQKNTDGVGETLDL